MNTSELLKEKRKLTSVDIDRAILERAKKLGGVSTNKQIIDIALVEFVQRREQKNLLDIMGTIQFADDYDYKAMRANKEATE